MEVDEIQNETYKILNESTRATFAMLETLSDRSQAEQILGKELGSNSILYRAVQNGLTRREYINLRRSREDLPEILKDYTDEALIPFGRVFLIERGTPFCPEKILKLSRTKEELSQILQQYNRLQGLKAALAAIASCESEKRTELLRIILENFFEYDFDTQGNVLQTPVDKAAALAQEAMAGLDGHVELKKEQEHWHTEFYIHSQALDELSANIITLLTKDFENTALKGKSLDEYLKDYYEDYTDAMGKKYTDETIKAIQGGAAQAGLALAGGFTVPIPAVPVKCDKRQRYIDLSLFTEMPDETDIYEIYKIHRDFFWPQENEPAKPFEEFKNDLIRKFKRNVPFVIKDSSGKFIGFFTMMWLEQDTIRMNAFNIRQDLRSIETFNYAFKQMVKKVEEIILKTNIRYINCLAPNSLLQKWTKAIGFKMLRHNIRDIPVMCLDTEEYFKRI